MSTTGNCNRPAVVPFCSNARSAGFTLLELLVVVALIALIGALGMPKLQLFFEGDALQASARQCIGLVRQSAQLARQQQQAYVLRYASAQHALVAEPADTTGTARADRRQAGKTGQVRSLRLPESVQLAAIYPKKRQQTRQRGQEQRLYITSQGYSEPAVIVLSARDGKEQLSLVASPFLGRIKVVEGYADPASAALFR